MPLSIAACKRALRYYEQTQCGGSKLVDVRRLLNQISANEQFKGGTIPARRALQPYSHVLPENTKIDQVVMPRRTVPSHFFRFDQTQQYRDQPIWSDLRPGSEVHNFQTKKRLVLLKLHYKSQSMDNPDEYDMHMHRILSRLAPTFYAGPQLACVKEAIDYLILNDFGTDACGRAQPDDVLAAYICRLGFDGWIRLGNAQSVRQLVPQIAMHASDEVYLCDLDQVTWTGPRS